ncbi:MAG TPA: nucleotide exchange factor GrpE [Blastocatellia bacterium]|jgi:molecular chaperone GrpE|nr:nucleotide exchange factor GrpE [Blastocatellia bacterium]
MGNKKNEPGDSPIALEDPIEEKELNLAKQPLNEDEFDIGDDEQLEAEDVHQATNAAAEPNDDADDASASEADPFLSLQSQVETLTREKTALYDQLLRRAAEFENYRRRVERERSDAYQRARVEVLVEFLPVVDNFERALSSLEDSGGDAEALRQGVELIHKQFKDALTKFGLEPIDAIGHTFDPHLHEAVTIEATNKHKENTVIEEFQRGYKIGDKLLRPAKVKVAATPE